MKDVLKTTREKLKWDIKNYEITQSKTGEGKLECKTGKKERIIKWLT